MIEALHTQGRPVPWEMIEVWLCRDVYHCTPTELDEQDPIRVMRHLEAISGEATVRRVNRRK